jgi:hypothetical protein
MFRKRISVFTSLPVASIDRLSLQKKRNRQNKRLNRARLEAMKAVIYGHLFFVDNMCGKPMDECG